MRTFVYDPGELDQRINILRQVKVEDEGGGFETSEIVLYDGLWAKIKSGTPGERYNFEQVHNTENVIFVIRKRSDILETDVIEWEGIRFNIRGIPSVNRRVMYLEIQAERGVGD